MSITNKRQLESSMSIPVYEGSMLSLRTNSSNPNSLKEKITPRDTDGYKIDNINWKCGKLNPDFLCAYCNTYLKSPVKLQECNHRVCSSCLTDLLKLSAACPTCKHPFERDQVIVDKDFQRELQNLQVYCSNEPNGCNWEGIFKNILLHLEDCEYASISCKKGCGLKYLRKNEKEHQDDDCLKNESQCEFCGISYEKHTEVEHLNTCPDFLIPCPNQCGINEIMRKEIQNHLENECPKHEILCPFGDSGCAFTSLRTEMAKHMKESPGIHLNLLCKTVSLQKQQMRIISEVIEKQKKELFEINNKLLNYEKFFGPQFIWKIDNYMEKFNESKSGKKASIFSPTFLSSRHGYKLALSAALYGDGKAKGKYMSLYVCICKGDFDALLSWPFNHKIILTLLDQSKNPTEQRPISYTIKPNTCKENLAFLGRPIGERNASFGAQKFVELEVLNTFEYISDDAIFISVAITFENN